MLAACVSVCSLEAAVRSRDVCSAAAAARGGCRRGCCLRRRGGAPQRGSAPRSRAPLCRPSAPAPQLPEYGCQAALTALLLLTGRWAYGGLHAALLVYHARQVRLLGGARTGCLPTAQVGRLKRRLAANPCPDPAEPFTPPMPSLPQFLRGQHLADVTEIFRQVKAAP